MGITKRQLVKAFIEARHIFFSSLQERDSLQVLLEATQVMLLFDPEHLTAANYRKRALLDLKNGAASATSQYPRFVEAELYLLESFLTSPLHRHTKSPTLWNHRRFVMELFSSQTLPVDMDTLCNSELAIVMRAGEKHPKNYYAWNLYAKWLFTFLKSGHLALDQSHSFQCLTSDSISSVHEWCLRHPSDISGWSFLLLLFRHLHDTSSLVVPVSKTLDLAFSFRWSHEAVWTFLRTVLGSDVLLPATDRRALTQRIEERLRNFETVQLVKNADVPNESMAELKTYKTDYSFMREALDWVERWGTTTDGDIDRNVGVGGHFTHGGYGYAARRWGLALDTIISLDVVLANGSYIHAINTTYPEIFYVGSISFDLTTSSHFYPSQGFRGVADSREAAAEYFLGLQIFAQNASVVDRNLGFGTNTDGTDFHFQGIYFGGLVRFNDEILPEILRHLPTPESKDIQELSWLDSLTKIAREPLIQPLIAYDVHANFVSLTFPRKANVDFESLNPFPQYAKSIVTQETEPLKRETLESYFGYVINNGRHLSSPWFTVVNLYGGADSQINTIPASSTAYPQRSSLWVFQNQGATSDPTQPFPDDIIPFITNLTDSVTHAQPGAGFASAPNYVDPSLTAAQAHQLYYGDETYQRLLALKTRIDPDAVFLEPSGYRSGVELQAKG
ncbi:MAG: hypothetical protein M1837_006060 [Sclerophora amabilis]|nr:MAG: hypothetical protein M1837_006060 [Sclerophora amabilis]